ncbi:MAG TPA: DUF4124 domain-containing protein [Steroidobacteraceae bacterium]
MKRALIPPAFLTLLSVASHASAVYKCTVDGRVTFQDTPCPRGVESAQIGPDSAREAATRKQEQAAAKAKLEAAEKLSLDRLRQTQEKQRAEGIDRAVEEARASDAAWRDAVDKVRVGMTDAELERLHPRLRFGGRTRTMDGPNGRHDEWRTFDHPHFSIHMINGAVAFIHR